MSGSLIKTRKILTTGETCEIGHPDYDLLYKPVHDKGCTAESLHRHINKGLKSGCKYIQQIAKVLQQPWKTTIVFEQRGRGGKDNQIHMW